MEQPNFARWLHHIGEDNSSLVRRTICPKRVGIRLGLGLGLGFELGLGLGLGLGLWLG